MRWSAAGMESSTSQMLLSEAKKRAALAARFHIIFIYLRQYWNGL